MAATTNKKKANPAKQLVESAAMEYHAHANTEKDARTNTGKDARQRVCGGFIYRNNETVVVNSFLPNRSL